MNTYGYVDGNPVKAIDPFGLDAAVIPRAPGLIIDPGSMPGTDANKHRLDVTTQGINQISESIKDLLNSSNTNTDNSAEDDNVIPFPGTKVKEKDETDACPTKPKRGSDCTFTGLAGIVPSTNGFGAYLQCQYRCPRKGLKIDTSYIGIKTKNPGFLCPKTIPESWFP